MGLTGRGTHMVTVVSLLVALATLAVGLRLYARLKLRLKVQLDDYLCMGAWVCLIAMFIELILWCTIGGNGSHMQDLTLTEKLNFGKIFLANQFTYFVLCPTLRISILFFYRRIFSTPLFMHISAGLIALITLWGIGIFLTCALQCRPLKASWDPRVEATCIDTNTFFIVNQVFNVVMDFVMLALPLPIIWSLNRNWREKLALSGIFLLGGFVCFASIFRIVVLFYIDPADTTYTIFQATLWTHIEPAVGMTCACLPSLRGLIPRFYGRRSRSDRSSNNNNNNKLYGDSSSRDRRSNKRASEFYNMSQHLYTTRQESDENLVSCKRGDSSNDAEEGIRVHTDIRVSRQETDFRRDVITSPTKDV
ncbi:integral membrane protein [Geosmithia morbida]|uniref:Integral membrane protein n=1 Tax=Geosmithia morbida TaxID=1094350 RepID=A0A9P4Z273_9HYPO|nr:uncharacterized protein GMORB2_1154 [Geosmithia morbida]KAF4125908.1 integral membrane protein [Geosmithia morbida]